MSVIWRDSLFTDAPEKLSTDRAGFPQECYLSLAASLLGLSHFLGLCLLLFFLVRPDILYGYVMNVCFDARVRPVHTYVVALLIRPSTTRE